MMVKVCGITRREDAVTAAEAGASAIGLIFYPKSPRYVTPERAAELGEGLDLWKVGIFVDEKPAGIEAVMRAARLDVAQIYGGEAPPGARIWKAFRVTGTFDVSLTKDAEAILLDGTSNGTSFDWSAARGVKGKVIVAGGLDASNVAEAIRVARPWGVDASSRLETAPGIKDHHKIRAFVRAALRTDGEAA
ncbi:MAG: phosphoribosylanthranilate isomerase [Bryobacterales bacterium]|nr:phosphoribosylanthranilate isomerase [Bryobacterales bacterium]